MGCGTHLPKGRVDHSAKLGAPPTPCPLEDHSSASNALPIRPPPDLQPLLLACPLPTCCIGLLAEPPVCLMWYHWMVFLAIKNTFPSCPPTHLHPSLTIGGRARAEAEATRGHHCPTDVLNSAVKLWKEPSSSSSWVLTLQAHLARPLRRGTYYFQPGCLVHRRLTVAVRKVLWSFQTP